MPSGSSTPATTTVEATQEGTTEPWAPQQPYIKKGLELAGEFGQKRRPQFGGQTYAGFDPATESALSSFSNLATDPTSTMNRAIAQNAATASGANLRPDNPIYQNMLQSSFDLGRTGPESAFAAAGRGPSPMQRAAVLGNTSNIFTQNWLNPERQRQEAAIGRAGQMGQMPGELLSRVGGLREQQAQKGIDEDMWRFDWTQGGGEEEGRLDRFLNRVGQPWGQQSTSVGTQQQPYFQGK